MQFCLVTFLLGKREKICMPLTWLRGDVFKSFHLTCIQGYFLFLAQFLYPPCMFLWKIPPWPCHMTCTELPPLSSCNLCKLPHRTPSHSLQGKPDQMNHYPGVVSRGKRSLSYLISLLLTGFLKCWVAHLYRDILEGNRLVGRDINAVLPWVQVVNGTPLSPGK